MRISLLAQEVAARSDLGPRSRAEPSRLRALPESRTASVKLFYADSAISRPATSFSSFLSLTLLSPVIFLISLSRSLPEFRSAMAKLRILHLVFFSFSLLAKAMAISSFCAATFSPWAPESAFRRSHLPRALCAPASFSLRPFAALEGQEFR